MYICMHYAPSWECRSFVCMHLAHEILMKSMTSTSLLLLDSLGNPFRAISRILSPQKSLAVKISFTVVEYITYTNSPQEKKSFVRYFWIHQCLEMGSRIIYFIWERDSYLYQSVILTDFNLYVFQSVILFIWISG